MLIYTVKLPFKKCVQIYIQTPNEPTLLPRGALAGLYSRFPPAQSSSTFNHLMRTFCRCAVSRSSSMLWIIVKL